MPYIQVAIDISAKALDKLYTYDYVGQSAIAVGSIVKVPFGRSNHQRQAYVIDIKEDLSAKELAEYQIKKVSEVVTGKNLASHQIRLAYQMQHYYQTSLTAALKLMLPPRLSVRYRPERYYRLTDCVNKRSAYLEKLEGSSYHKRRQVIIFMGYQERVAEKEILQTVGCSRSVIKTLVKDRILVIEDSEKSPVVEVLDVNQDTVLIEGYVPRTTTLAQRQVIDAILRQFNGVHLLYGVTGSGKTQVYFELIDKVLEKGQSAIVLVPEIGLTGEMIRRFSQRFGPIIGALHSRLSAGEKLREWEKANQGQIRIMIGPRSALFAPFKNLGIIILDEEHEDSYKADQNPKYDAREVAIMRGHIEGVPVVMGSATPSLNSYYKALNGRYYLHCLPNKVLANQPIDVRLVDMSVELKEGHRHFLSRPLKNAIDQALERQEQVMILNNRRGYAKIMTCKECTHIFECPHCDLPLTYHQTNQKLICHQCGYAERVQKSCPQCGSVYIKALGVGTQKVEKELASLYLTTPIFRMDFDTTFGKYGHNRLLKAFEAEPAAILVGTQMIAKGYDLHNVTVVGVIGADRSLYMEDYRSNERTFRLLTQVIGRTGRGHKPGAAYIQTYSPNHFVIQKSLKQDYQAFYEEEIIYRQLLNNPPFKQLLQLVTSDRQQRVAEQLAVNLNKIIEHVKNVKQFEWQVLGPVRAGIAKRQDRYRYKIVVKATERRSLLYLIKAITNYQAIYKMKGDLSVDINPSYMA